ncbi:Ubiquinol oxidase 4, chloroplastic/chromoplastic [Linum perenne]
MAVTCCSAAHATLPAINKASSSLNTRNSPLRYNLHSLASRRPSLSRKFYTTRASVVRESEKKVVVEQTFPPKTSTLDQQDGRGGSQKDPPQTSWDRSIIKIEQSINIFLTDSVIKILDTFYQDRDYARFYVLETIARVPYFAFISVLHLYESFGWWRRADYIKVHFAESWNEMHHLLIMEELGGNNWWFDRFLAQHVAVFYYFMTVFMYALSPRMAYHFSECVEHHAFSTYDKFIKANEDELKELPAPEVAVRYYTGGDLYLFDEFQTSRSPNTRRPKIDTLYDTFVNIREDEGEHCKTMKACQTPGNLHSPHAYSDDDDAAGEDDECVVSEVECQGIVDCIKKSVSSGPTKQKV